MIRFIFIASFMMFAGAGGMPVAAAPFVHPGMLQTRQNLEFMRQKVLAGEEPWKTAWSNLCSKTYSAMDFQPRPVTYVVRGPYGRPSIGDRVLMNSANAAYSQALQWVVTGDRDHAEKAIAILNAWSGRLWHFEGNDAKLLAGWTGHRFCNAAEILCSTDSGWKKADIAQFKRMLLTVYYPLLKDYFPEANGNWDAAMMDSLLCIGVFCDNHTIFDNAVNHFLRGTGNGGITKYVYPSGQCEESTRDQAHTQLGLGELAQACQVAWNQGVDLYGAADDRLALGVEYTARYNLGQAVPVYGTISARGRGKLRDIYEGVYQHYHFAEGLEMPWTERAIAKARAGKSWSALILYQGPVRKTPASTGALQASGFAPQAGALNAPTAPAPADAIKVSPGEAIQTALDACTNGGWVLLGKGVFVLPASLRIPSDVTLAGQGLKTILTLDPALTTNRAGTTIVNGDDNLHDVTLRDFVVDGSTRFHVPANGSPGRDDVSLAGSRAVTPHPPRRDPNQERRRRASPLAPSRAGIIFDAQRPGQMRHVRFVHLTVRHCTHDGVAVRGAADVAVVACDFSDNGSSVAPGPGLQDDLQLSHVVDCRIRDSRLDDSPWGSGLTVSFASDVTITNNEAARNALCGIRLTDSHGVRVCGNLTEGNDHDGIAVNVLAEGNREISISANLSRNNGDCGIKVDHVVAGSLKNNSALDNGCARQIMVTDSKSVKR